MINIPQLDTCLNFCEALVLLLVAESYLKGTIEQKSRNTTIIKISNYIYISSQPTTK